MACGPLTLKNVRGVLGRTRRAGVLVDCKEIYLHVHVEWDDALRFYERFGFSRGEVIKDYYTRLENNDALIVSKQPPFTLPSPTS